MKKYFFLLVLSIFFLTNFNTKVCNLSNFYYSSFDFGFKDTYSFCKNKMEVYYKNLIKNLIIKTPFEMKFRKAFTNKNT